MATLFWIGLLLFILASFALIFVIPELRYIGVGIIILIGFAVLVDRVIHTIRDKRTKASIESSTPAPDLDDEGVDEDLLQSAIAIIRETQRASVSLLQRRLKIGYNRAGRLMDKLEEKGIVGPATVPTHARY